MVEDREKSWACVSSSLTLSHCLYLSHYVLTFKHLTLHISQLHHSIIIADENGSPWQLWPSTTDAKMCDLCTEENC